MKRTPDVVEETPDSATEASSSMDGGIGGALWFGGGAPDERRAHRCFFVVVWRRPLGRRGRVPRTAALVLLGLVLGFVQDLRQAPGLTRPPSGHVALRALALRTLRIGKVLQAPSVAPRTPLRRHDKHEEGRKKDA
eukprot:scaffold1421_cov255-Pinguiococcus_pyrenoidosus.AAC.3